jgi:hypothetical protein
MGLMDKAVMNPENVMKLDPHEQEFRKNPRKVLEIKGPAHKGRR